SGRTRGAPRNGTRPSTAACCPGSAPSRAGRPPRRRASGRSATGPRPTGRAGSPGPGRSGSPCSKFLEHRVLSIHQFQFSRTGRRMNEIGIGIVGANPDVGWSFLAHVPAIAATPGLRVAAVSTTRVETARRAAELLGGLPWFTDAGELAAAPDVDL